MSNDVLIQVDGPPTINTTIESRKLIIDATEPVKLILQVDDRILFLGMPSPVAIAPFLVVPDLTEDTDAIHFFFGWSNISGSWLVRRQTRADSTSVDATIANNPSHPDLDSSWAVKEGLVYA